MLSHLLNELLLIIIQKLNYASALAFSLSSKQTRFVCSVFSSNKQYTFEDLLSIERWPAYNGAANRADDSKQPIAGLDFVSCSICMRIRSAEYFSSAMMRGKRGKSLQPITKYRQGRFCLECGINSGRYQRGTAMAFGGAHDGYGRVCDRCGKFFVKRFEMLTWTPLGLVKLRALLPDPEQR